jgi:hypothetical protein
MLALTGCEVWCSFESSKTFHNLVNGHDSNGRTDCQFGVITQAKFVLGGHDCFVTRRICRKMASELENVVIW